MNRHTLPHLRPYVRRGADSTPRSRSAGSAPAGHWSSTILRADSWFLLVAGLAALGADLVGYFFGAGPFAALADQPLALGTVEAHGLAALVGMLMRRVDSGDRWRWHAVALAVHLFLGVCNLLFWNVYAVMDVPRAGVISTVAHAVLFSAQLSCLALGAAVSREELPGWVRRLRHAGLYVRSAAITTLVLGAGTHIATIVLGRAALPRILTPGFEVLLTVPMFYVSVAGWLAWRTFRFRGRWHKVALAFVLIYFPVGLPLHLRTIMTSSTAHYTAFPEQYSLLIVPVMAAFITCFACLRLQAGPGASRDAQGGQHFPGGFRGRRPSHV